ncbi:MAG TPA: AbfB domain-containing protein [Patescibacteria group bacterium]|nr:AbfB domain-containing protein [Patescibacteria group bacterium]
MYLNSVLKGLITGSVVSLALLVPQLSYAQEPSSFRSWNYPDHYIRHRLSLGYIDSIVASDKLGRKDATFRLVPGLAGKCRSFESVNYPGHFLRHQNYRLKLAQRSNDQLFREDATFCVVSGLASSNGRSFESVNFPKHYIRHSNFELWIAKSDGSQLFKKDATFIISPPLTEHSPPVPFDKGTNLNPVSE